MRRARWLAQRSVLLCMAASCIALALYTVPAYGAAPSPAATSSSRVSSSSSSHLSAVQKQVLNDYVGAIEHERYADAFHLLTSQERTYFRNAQNFESIFTADGLKITSFRIVGSRDAGSLGTIGLVSENISFFDHAHQVPATATVKVPYGLIASHGTYQIKDPFHPWKAFRPTAIETTANGLRVVVRKVSFFTQRIETLLTFTNVGTGFVTVLPYGRSVLRDESGVVFHPLATKVSVYTDKQFYLGLRLAANAQYTGALNFIVTTKVVPHRLMLTIAPALRDGADAPFDLALPPIDVP
jgi:hypothetical protein